MREKIKRTRLRIEEFECRNGSCSLNPEPSEAVWHVGEDRNFELRSEITDLQLL